MTTESMATTGLGPDRQLRQALGDRWLLILLRGIAAIVFGVLSLVWPGLSLATLVLLFGAYALVDGVFALIAAVTGKPALGSRWWLAVEGLFGIAAGVVTFMWPGMTALVLLYIIGFWAVAIGIFEIIGAIRLRKEIEGEWLLILDGAVSVLFGVALLLVPSAGALAMIWLIAFFAIVFGAGTIALAFRVRKYRSAA